MLKDIGLAHDYRSDRSNLAEEFYVRCLAESIEYWRAVGYFTSHGLALAAKGLAAFVSNGGRMKLVASPLLEPEDIEAFIHGYETRERILEVSVGRHLDDRTIEALPDISRHRLECIAWLIGEGRLDIKLAMPSSELMGYGQTLYHEKIGVFFDREENAVAFAGSSNETVGGLLTNFESIEVYVSWDDPHRRVPRKVDNFQRLWRNHTPRLAVVDFPEAAKRQLLRLRPAKPPVEDPETWDKTVFGVKVRDVSISLPDLPSDIELRPYQMDACEAWFQHNGQGMLAMATGSGKTITSLAAAVRLLKEQERLFIVVACPFQHLVDQWAEDAERFGFRPLRAYESRHTWESTVNSRILDYNLGNRSQVMVISTHATLAGDVMQASLARLTGPSLLIVDEAHHLGAEVGRRSLPMQVRYRMGLSATPDRWFDDEGTEALHDYFGDTVFEFTLAEAIAQGFLSEYYYHPHLVELTDDELEEYERLTRRIAQLFDSADSTRGDSLLEFLLRQRADILNRAENKLGRLAELVGSEEDLHHALFYCVPGQKDQVLSLLGNQFGLRVHQFTVEESTAERGRLLEEFTQGRLQGLVAIRCLDEGVDVPSTQVAYILASTSNPREFIQRRGRILRKSPGKERAVLHDLIAVPSLGNGSRPPSPEAFNFERGILRRELARFREFADASVNRFQATEIVWEHAKAYNLLDY